MRKLWAIMMAVLIIASLVLGAFPIQATNSIYASYTGANGSNAYLSANSWEGQTFTSSTSFYAKSVTVKLQTGGTPSGTITVYLESTAGGMPSKTHLSSGTYDASQVTGSWTEIEIPITSVYLTSSVKYAWVLKNNTATGINILAGAGDGYPSHTWAEIENGGSGETGTYQDGGSYDLWFKVSGALTNSDGIETGEVSEIKRTSVKISGMVTDLNSQTVVNVGIQTRLHGGSWSDDRKIEAGELDGVGLYGYFQTTISSLQPGTEYDYRVYMYGDTLSVVYGSTLTFTTTTAYVTPTPPTNTLPALTYIPEVGELGMACHDLVNITDSSFTVNCAVYDLGIDRVPYDLTLISTNGTFEEVTLGSGITNMVDYRVTVNGLTMGTVIKFRMKAVSGSFNSWSPIYTVTTQNTDQAGFVEPISDWFNSNGFGKGAWWIIAILFNGIILAIFREKIIIPILFGVLSIGAMISFGLVDIWILVMLAIIASLVVFMVFRRTVGGA
jgi:hypothetical protein